jgi:hypothetical protein
MRPRNDIVRVLQSCRSGEADGPINIHLAHLRRRAVIEGIRQEIMISFVFFKIQAAIDGMIHSASTRTATAVQNHASSGIGSSSAGL